MTRRKYILFFELLLLLIFTMSVSAFGATYSQYWKQDSAGNWHVYDGDGNLVKNAWLCDDAVSSNEKNIWYLIDANGDMIHAGLVQDKTGNYYSLEMNHDGYYGMLRYKSGSYTADGFTVSLQLESSHTGSFAAIKNEDGIKALKEKYGLKQVSIDNVSCVYTSAFAASAGSQNQAAAGDATGDAAGKEENTAQAEKSVATAEAAGTSSTLTTGDFAVSGSSVPQKDMIAYIKTNYGSDSAVFFYFDSSSDTSRAAVVKTARGITLASYKSDVINAYGQGVGVDLSSPSSTRALDVVYQFDPNGLKTYAKSCLAYFTADKKYGIYFCFKDNGQLSYIIYYAA